MSNKENIETLLNSLDEIVCKLENGNLSLDESISLYEKGAELSVKCKILLNNAKQKIDIIKNEYYDDNETVQDEDAEDIKWISKKPTKKKSII